MKFRTKPQFSTAKPTVERETGIISGVAVCTEGPALGHGVMLEAGFIESLLPLAQGWNTGLKSRFGHPSMSTNAVGTLLGAGKNFRLSPEGESPRKLLADLHLSQSAKSGPNGDLFSHVCDLAENDPDKVGTSIVFTPGSEYKYNSDGEKVFEYSDPEYGTERMYSDEFMELEGPSYATCTALNAFDLVDSPAANAGGLFSDSTIAGKVTSFLERNAIIAEAFDNGASLEDLITDERFTGVIENFLDSDIRLAELAKKPEALDNFKQKRETPAMNEELLKNDHPELYSTVFNKGVKQEKDRVVGHLLLGDASGDKESMLEGIKSEESFNEGTYEAKHTAFKMGKLRSLGQEDENAGELSKKEDNTASLAAIRAEACSKALGQGDSDYE